MKRQKKLLVVLLAICLLFFLHGCVGEAKQGNTEHRALKTMSGRVFGNFRRGSEALKYTKTDYDLALSFRTEGYENLTVADFNRKVLDWEDEENFHKTEEALHRLSNSLPQEDANGDFIFGTLFTSWGECEKKHYNACGQNSAPWYSVQIQRETLGDVFGDAVVVEGAYADFDFNYTIPDETKLTVGERDAILQSLESGMAKFLNLQDEKELREGKAMEKKLEAELQRQLKEWKQGVIWAGQTSLGYWYDKSWEKEDDIAEDTEEEYPTNYSKAQYELVLDKLKFQGYEELSVAEFNRRVHAAFYSEEDSEKSLWEAYDIVMTFLPETDPNYSFLQETVRIAQEEYRAREEEVLSGHTVDPEYSARAFAEEKEDVYGDTVVVGNAEANYTFTYRILDENGLTVKARDAFLTNVRQGAQDFLTAFMQKNTDSLAESLFQEGIEQAGKAAETNQIQFTGCTVDYCEVYS